MSPLLDTLRDAGLQALALVRSAREAGLWDLITAAGTAAISGVLLSRRRRRIDEFSIHLSYSMGTGHPQYPNVVNFELRNLMDSPLVIGRPNFRFADGFRSGNHAHGNSATDDYEIKFRPVGADGVPVPGYSYTVVMLRHREAAYSYLPIDDALDEAALLERLRPRRRFGLLPPAWWPVRPRIGTLTLDVVLLKDAKPQVVSMAVPVRNLKRGPQRPALGRAWAPAVAAPSATGATGATPATTDTPQGANATAPG